MKLKFSIQYTTQWGESLHVVLCYSNKDGVQRTQNLTMQTQDGQKWTLETSIVESRQYAVSSVTYYYQVEDSDGRLLRREWSQVPRTYWFDSSKTYVFDDQWRDLPLCAHLYSMACHTTRHQAHNEQVEARRLPLYRRTVIFRVSAPQLESGQSLALLGSHPAIGSWNTARYLRMEYIGCHDWILSVNMDAVILPVDYKYVVVDDKTHELLKWEEGDNRQLTDEVADGEVRVLYGGLIGLKEKIWRAAGVVIPVFSLRSEQSCGVGDFGDLRRLVDWAVTTGMKVIQLLPVNDTTTDGYWHDSYPYNITSCFALHPHYMDLGQLGTLKSRQEMTAFRRQQRELNALPYSDYEAVGRVKRDYISKIFKEVGEQVLATNDFKNWFDDNQWWLEPYANGSSLIFYTQYMLHTQLKAVADYARSKGVVLKGDVPIGVNRNSVETKTHPEFFHLDSSTGATPDAVSVFGQNWGFPTYNWDSPARVNTSSAKAATPVTIVDWFKMRYRWMEQYFDAIRIDHVLGFFRIWEIPADAVYGLLGHFSPALPLTVSEIEYFGLSFRKDTFTRPFINDRVLERLFGMHTQYVKDNFLNTMTYGLYSLKQDYNTQRKVVKAFDGMGDETSLWIRDGLLRLVANVLFIEDPHQPDFYHPRINAWQEPVFEALGSEEKEAYMRIYNNYYYQRHSMFWGNVAMHRLSDTLSDTRLLVCAEDLGMLPDCVSPVLDALRILTLEVQTMPKQVGYEFSHLDAYPYRSVCTISTHDMSPLRLWWEESAERSQRYYVTMLQKQGQAPEHLPAHLAEEIIARHLYCPSMLCMLSLQDWLAMDSELRNNHIREERINVPDNPYNRWQYRMHLTIEQLQAAERFNNKVHTMITRSKR